MTNIAIYCRVSKSDGSQNTERQLTQLREFAKHKKWNIVEEILENVSGRRTKRKGTKRLIDLAKSNRIQKVLIHEVSRLGRNQADTYNTVEELSQSKCSVFEYKSRQETLDKDYRRTTFANVIIPVFAGLAQQWVDDHSFRIMSGLKLAKQKGVKLGRPKQQKRKKQDEIIKLLQQGYIVIDEKMNKRVRASNAKIAKHLEIGIDTVKRVRKEMAVEYLKLNKK